MTISESAQASKAEQALTLVETCIRGLGIDPSATRSDRGDHVMFALRRGSARILIGVHAPAPALPDGRLRVVAPIVRLPGGPQETELMRRVLEVNAQELAGMAFAISGSDIIVVAERKLDGLDAAEVEELIRNVGRVADRYDDELAARFGASRSSDLR